MLWNFLIFSKLMYISKFVDVVKITCKTLVWCIDAVFSWTKFCTITLLWEVLEFFVINLHVRVCILCNWVVGNWLVCILAWLCHFDHSWWHFNKYFISFVACTILATFNHCFIDIPVMLASISSVLKCHFSFTVLQLSPSWFLLYLPAEDRGKIC